MFFYFLFCAQTCVIKSCRSTSTQRDSFDLASKSGTQQANLLYSRIPRNIFFFATHPRFQCLSLGEKGCLANTFGILFIVDSLCLSSKLKQLVLCQKVEQNCQTLFFIVVQRYLKVDISALVCKAMRVLLAPLFFEFLYLHYTVAVIVIFSLRFFIDPCCNFSVLYRVR